MKLGRRSLKLEMDDTIHQRNAKVDKARSQLSKAEIYEETKTIIPDKEPNPSSKRT